MLASGRQIEVAYFRFWSIAFTAAFGSVRTLLSLLWKIPFNKIKEKVMSLGTILLIVLVLMLIGAIPSWPHSKSWGYGPSGGLGLVVLILVVLLVMGRI